MIFPLGIIAFVAYLEPAKFTIHTFDHTVEMVAWLEGRHPYGYYSPETVAKSVRNASLPDLRLLLGACVQAFKGGEWDKVAACHEIIKVASEHGRN